MDTFKYVMEINIPYCIYMLKVVQFIMTINQCDLVGVGFMTGPSNISRCILLVVP